MHTGVNRIQKKLPGVDDSRARIYSIGHGNAAIGDFFARLQKHDIAVLCDVRRFPDSARQLHFQRQPLRQTLMKNGIRYEFLGDLLGGFRDGGYPGYMASTTFQDGFDQLVKIAGYERAAFLCAEFDPRQCHRRFIAERLQNAGFHVLHILKDGSVITQTDLAGGTTMSLF